MEHDIFDRLRQELRRGALSLAVLGQLDQAHYGYSLRQRLVEAGLDIEEGTLYPLIRRLESQGLLQSDWREENGRRRRYYQCSADAKVIYQLLMREWQQLNQFLEQSQNGAAQAELTTTAEASSASICGRDSQEDSA